MDADLEEEVRKWRQQSIDRAETIADERRAREREQERKVVEPLLRLLIPYD